MENINENILESSIFKDDIEIKILNANESFLTNENSSRIQFHPFIYFYFIVEGSGTFFIENDSIKIKKNDLVIINSNIGHNLYVDEDEYAVKTLGFGLESIGLTSHLDEVQSEEELELDNFFHITWENKEAKINEIFTKIVNEFHSENLYAKTLADALASYFLINFLRHFRNEIEVVPDININRRIDYIKSYIDNNYSLDLSLEGLSNMAYMNKFHLIAEFKQSYRVTPIEYLILKRIEVSKGLLISTNHSMETIAEIVGFNSQSYFNQVFRKKVGITPSQFRKKHRL
ncbi:Methylphosphotriester-DNA--protein-cysteine S-methyltransferase [Anaerococcus prevotii]|uniref:Transcriptional regulator, AraC family n=1 Tax=Anaerococcus prevotii (strain ATCC 9321 / DSM 20548 / JCM 6508 / NCTC 11806 / PC1) TaxID=525919 RepID=C7RDA0_ANAPD|nr:AraC family transcriptional regulator [Anaerococcus prevotii]ACV29163.1 transcriptional regulator, AraC family [Anaerococcus prevotii DSM 20548]SUU94837.1 Methylphosphotriester-DNA--protein-cysteine S-methyltransferase [Anaerococcus prevotii]